MAEPDATQPASQPDSPHSDAAGGGTAGADTGQGDGVDWNEPIKMDKAMREHASPSEVRTRSDSGEWEQGSPPGEGSGE